MMYRVRSFSGQVPTLAVAVVAALIASGCSSSVRFSSGPMPVHEKKAPRKTIGPENDDRKAITGADVEPSRLDSILTNYMGTPYHWGGMSRAGIDCSGLVCCVFRELGGAMLPHDARLMHKLGHKIPLAEARLGDLLFFSTGFWSGINHVGVCVGNGRFVHASTKLGVIESDINDNYYKSRFVQARRLYQ